MKINVSRIIEQIDNMSSLCEAGQRLEWMFQCVDNEVVFAGEVVENNHVYKSQSLMDMGKFKLQKFTEDYVWIYGKDYGLTRPEINKLWTVYTEKETK